MAHSYFSGLFHCVFSTKQRRRSITPIFQERLWAYMGGIARENRMKALAVGGIEDHVHLALSIPRTMDIARAMKLIKGTSSAWINQEIGEYRRFSWQEGYGAFSIGVSQLEATRRYIANQADHHRVVTFQEELMAILEKHGLECDLDRMLG